MDPLFNASITGLITMSIMLIAIMLLMITKKPATFLHLLALGTSAATAYLFALAGLPWGVLAWTGLTFLLVYLTFAPMFWQSKP